MISLQAIEDIINSEGFSQSSNVINTAGTELWNHTKLPSQPLLKQTLTKEEILRNYQGAIKELNKLKRLDPNEKIIDGYDIDWTGFEVTLLGQTFHPQTSFELFDLIFRFLDYLYNLHINTDVIWNDPDKGEKRDEHHQLNWADNGVAIEDLLQTGTFTTIGYGPR